MRHAIGKCCLLLLVMQLMPWGTRAAYPLSPNQRERIPKSIASVSFSANNSLYLYGGVNNGRAPMDQLSSVSFDQHTGDLIYQLHSGTPGPPIYFSEAVLTPDNSSMLLFGGDTTTSNSTQLMSMLAFQYHFDNSTWLTINNASPEEPDDANNTVPLGRSYFKAILSSNRLVYIFGGVDNINFTAPHHDFWSYNPSNKTFAQLPYPGFTMSGYVAAALEDGTIVYLTGSHRYRVNSEDPNDDIITMTPPELAVVYDTNTGMWSNVTIDTTYSTGPQITFGAMAVLGPEKRYIYLVGGQGLQEDYNMSENRLYVLDTETWAWHEPNLPGPHPVGRMFGNAALISNEYAVFAFGQTGLNMFSGDIDVLKLPALVDGTADWSTAKWVENVVTGETGQAPMSSDAGLGAGAIAGIVVGCIVLVLIIFGLCFRRLARQILRKLYFGFWDPRTGEPRWVESTRLALKIFLLFLFIAFFVFLLLQVLHSPTATYTVSEASPNGLTIIPDIRFCFEGYPITGTDPYMQFPYVNCNTDASTPCNNWLVPLNMSVHEPVFVAGTANTTCFLFRPGEELKLAAENRPGENNGTTLRFILFVGDTTSSIGRVHVTLYPPGRDPNAVVYLADTQQQLSEAEVDKWLADDHNSFQSETVIDLEPRYRSNVEYQLEEHKMLQADVSWNYVGFAPFTNSTTAITVSPHTQPMDPNGWSPKRDQYVINEVYVRPTTAATMVYREQKIYTLVQTLGLLGGVLGLLSTFLRLSFGNRAPAPFGFVQRWAAGATSLSLLKDTKGSSFSSKSRPIIPFVSPVYPPLPTGNHYDDDLESQKDTGNKDISAVQPLQHHDHLDPQGRVARLEDRMHLFERVFKSYYINDEVFVLLDEDTRPSDRRHNKIPPSSSSPPPQTRLASLFRRTSQRKSTGSEKHLRPKKKRWIRVPQAQRTTDHSPTSSSTSLDEIDTTLKSG